MRRLFCAIGVCCSLLLLGGCDASELGTLPEVSRPYAAVYECEVLTYGGGDVLGRFDYVRLDLDWGGEFTLAYRTKEGAEGEQHGTYSVDDAASEVVFTFRFGAVERSRAFPIEMGRILLDVTLHGKLLHAEFGM